MTNSEVRNGAAPALEAILCIDDHHFPPTLQLRAGPWHRPPIHRGTRASNDNWCSDQEAEIIATTIPPSNDLESAIVQNLTPGNYTAIVRGVNGTTGVALVEAYGLN